MKAQPEMFGHSSMPLQEDFLTCRLKPQWRMFDGLLLSGHSSVRSQLDPDGGVVGISVTVLIIVPVL